MASDTHFKAWEAEMTQPGGPVDVVLDDGGDGPDPVVTVRWHDMSNHRCGAVDFFETPAPAELVAVVVAIMRVQQGDPVSRVGDGCE